MFKLNYKRESPASLKTGCLQASFILFFILISINGIGQLSPEPREGFLAGQPVRIPGNVESGLLFYLSGNNGFAADLTAGGQVFPNFLKDVSILQEGKTGPGVSAGDSQLLSWWAPGNIFAQRGTLSFFWRSRYPVGPTPFPVFRVGYADHSSWDMTWLRIDYNGSGFDAFVTDIGLARTRVSYSMDKIPGPDEWIHLALSWDETEGIRFYVNGELAARQTVNHTVYDSGLDQFGPHSRIISPYQVQSAYCFMRGGDLDELCIYDRMLPDESIPGLANGNLVRNLPPLKRPLSERHWRDAWWLRHGWNLPNSPPPVLPSSHVSIRKVEIPDAIDINRWYWKANDGIRETTWPGVYNMSRLPGRYDYFVLPDWDCYSGSGQSVRFFLPGEPWNHVEIWGKAWGQLTLESESGRDFTFGIRTQKQVKSWHRINETRSGGTIRFDNAVIEEPIGSFDVYNVHKGSAPEGMLIESFKVSVAPDQFDGKPLNDLVAFIRGRYPADERSMMVGIPAEKYKESRAEPSTTYSYPYIHILIPYADHPGTGLDGIEIRLPSLKVKPTHNAVFPMNIRVKDPLWPIRDLADFSFSVAQGDAPVLWMDTRDRILPQDRALYLTLAGAGDDFTSELLEGFEVRLVYKSKDVSRKEHVPDRFRQVRDLYAHVVEERPASPRLNLYNRMIADCNDLLTVDPDHWLGQAYRYAINGKEKPLYKVPENPAGTPEWAFLQIEYLKHLERIADYYIDKRQIANGEFGGGLSDDGDLTNMWPGIAFLGIHPDKMLQSLQLHMTAYCDEERPPFDAGLRQRSLPLFTNGLATILTDELHALEDGIQVVGQLQLLDYGNPLYMERGMETARRMLHDVTQVNPAGHRHFRSRYYSGTHIATEDPWQWSVNRSYLVLHSSYMTAWYNGNPDLRKMVTDLADGLLAHRSDGKIMTEFNFSSDEARDNSGTVGAGIPWSLFSAATHLSGEQKYLEPIAITHPGQRKFDPERISSLYRDEITNLGIREYINTEGSVWIDRLSSFNPMIQEDRLGGTALTRTSVLYPDHVVSWKFISPATYKDAAIFISKASSKAIDIITFNLDDKPVNAEMTVWNVEPGRWRVLQGLDANNDQQIDGNPGETLIEIQRGESLLLKFAPRTYNLVSLELIEPAEKGYWELPDLGIGPSDVNISGNTVTVRVHSLGGAASPSATLVLKDNAGNIKGRVAVPPLEAPLDLIPRWKEVTFTLPEDQTLTGGILVIDPEKKIRQITRRNDSFTW